MVPGLILGGGEEDFAAVYLKNNHTFGNMEDSNATLMFYDGEGAAENLINDEEYNTETEIDSLTGNVSSPSGAAYVGLGWGNPVKRGKRFGVMFDVGVMMVGEADVELVAVCPEGSLSCHSLQSDVDIEEAKLQADLGDAYKFWPVVNLALSYQF